MEAHECQMWQTKSFFDQTAVGMLKGGNTWGRWLYCSFYLTSKISVCLVVNFSVCCRLLLISFHANFWGVNHQCRLSCWSFLALKQSLFFSLSSLKITLLTLTKLFSPLCSPGLTIIDQIKKKKPKCQRGIHTPADRFIKGWLLMKSHRADGAEKRRPSKWHAGNSTKRLEML